MPYQTMPIVGAYFRPPAQALINVLAVGTPLILAAEPTNDYDPNAVAVWLDSAHISENAHPNLEEILPSLGFSLDGILSEQYWHLGYVPKGLAAQLRSAEIVTETSAPSVTFSLSPTGKPQITFASPIL